jgi:ParB family protein of integrating conjugative element (PFGI_1 class)
MNAIAIDQAVTKKLLRHPQNDKEKTYHKLLTIDQIIPYDRNPRRVTNPRYAEIKAAIRAAGKLNNLLSVTRRPGDTYYMVESGGNTRLQILNELWKETHDETFFKTDCLIVPWQSESHVLSAHLIENELRGDMTLIDKALAINDLKAQLENEGGQALSRNEFIRQLTTKGYPVSKRQLIRFEYAADFLEPLIPMALNEGLGVRAVDRLIKIQTGYSKCLTEFGATQNFEPMFAQALTEHDDEDLDIDALQRTLDNYIVNCTGEPLNRIRLHVDTLLLDNHGEQETSLEPFNSIYQPAPVLDLQMNNGLNLVHKATLPDNSHQEITFQPRQAEHLARADIEPPSSNDSPGLSNLTDTTPTPLKLSDLPSLRTQCRRLAQQLTNEIPLTLAVKPWGQGYGFYLDLPEQPIQDELAYYIFWLLVGLSGQHLSSERTKLAQEMRFAQLILAEQVRNAYEVVGSPAQLDHLGTKVLLSKRLPEVAMATLLRLIQGCRQISLTYRESDIFECMTVEQTQLRDRMAKLAEHQNTADGDPDE